MTTPDDLQQRIGGIAALHQPLRRALYGLVSRDGWTTRDEAADALDIPRSVAAFHLDKLAEAGVLEVTFERTTGRSGPGAGRPSKLYRRGHDELSATVPPRTYDLAGALLASAVEEADRTGAPVGACVSAVARAEGRRIGEEAREGMAPPAKRGDWRAAIVDVLAQNGYEPGAGRRKAIVLSNCPFHRLAESHRALVCGMNLELLTGVLEGLGADDRFAAELAPEEGRCCIRFTPR